MLAVIIGAVFGFVVGLTSVGSGTFFGLVMVLVYPLTMPKIVGTDIFHAAALLWVAGIGHMIGGNVDYHATAWLLTGSIPGVLISSRFTVRLPDVVLRVALGTILFLSGLKLLDVPEAQWILLGGLDRARPRARRVRALLLAAADLDSCRPPLARVGECSPRSHASRSAAAGRSSASGSCSPSSAGRPRAGSATAGSSRSRSPATPPTRRTSAR